MKPALVILLALPLAGCPALDIIESNPSPYKAAHEQRTALVTPVVASVEQVAFVEPEPECSENVFRVYRCNGGEMFDWWSGEPI